MPIVEQNGVTITIEVTKRLLEFFNENRIRTANVKGLQRWQPGAKIKAVGAANLNSYSMHLSGEHLLWINAFSYSFSPLNWFVSIGRYCSIAPGVKLMGPQHPLDCTTSSEILYRKDGFFADTFTETGVQDWEFLRLPNLGQIIIENDVWIGQDVILKQGVKIGTGAVVGAGAVVVRDVSPYEIVGGVPAKHIRFRFDESLIKDLLESEWWRLSIPQHQHLPWHKPYELVLALREQGQVEEFHSALGTIRSIIEQTD